MGNQQLLLVGLLVVGDSAAVVLVNSTLLLGEVGHF